MQTTTTIGLDIAKSVFQVHGVDAAGQVISWRHAWLASRLAPRLTIGRANSRHLGIPCG